MTHRTLPHWNFRGSHHPIVCRGYYTTSLRNSLSNFMARTIVPRILWTSLYVMTRTSVLLPQLLITAVLAAVVSLAIPVFVDRHDYAAAVVNETRKPSPQNEAILRAERAKNQRLAFRSHVAAAATLFVLMNAGWLIARRWSEKSPGRA